MKSYKDFEKHFIGSSDIAALILVGCKDEQGVVTEPLHFGEDGCYYAYVVDEETEIGNHYTKVATFTHWLRIYDDEEKTFGISGREINVYRAGEFGCVIQVIK